MSDASILYLGDSSLNGAAGYLAGLMTRFGIGFDYLPSNEPLSIERANTLRRLFILSDYAAKNIEPEAQLAIVHQVHRGAGLLMIGGWESFHGHGGEWNGTPIGNILPVEISAEDDRINCDQPAMLIASQAHAITAELPWNVRPPTVGGFNRVITKPGSEVVLLVQRFAALYEAGRFEFTPQDQDPMLVVGAHGKGRTAAFMTDLAPHWVGGFVDWGDDQRITAQAEGSWQIEVGNFYAQFVINLLTWTGNLHLVSLGK